MDEKCTHSKRQQDLWDLYLILAITAAYGIMNVSSQTKVGGDTFATAKNILSKSYKFSIISL